MVERASGFEVEKLKGWKKLILALVALVLLGFTVYSFLIWDEIKDLDKPDRHYRLAGLPIPNALRLFYTALWC